MGHVATGLPLRNGKRLQYRCNAFIAFLISICTFAALYKLGFDVTYIHRKFIPMATAAIALSTVMSFALYFKSLSVPQNELAEGGNSGYFIYDFFMGRELNPRIGELDLKFFCELRPGLIGWVMFDLAFIVRVYESTGTVPASLLLVAGFHTLYVADALWYEECILTTMDIVHDGFGFMLAFGDFAWVPFLYSLQARFLAEHPQDWSLLALALILVLNMAGYVVFRGSNSQKNNFRKDPHHPSVAYLETLQTKTGRKLLVSGWWGYVRHPNYLGDLMMATAWSLPCGFQNILPYFYPLYFLGLLIHRNGRDEHNCRNKYGKDWDRYCQRVKYAIFPYIY